ncbi:MAG: hypothetical protein NC548_10690 [Lachnospiraceae bacterium]|nr:hypothetical protein [Lachnospiraceae bacterium]
MKDNKIAVDVLESLLPITSGKTGTDVESSIQCVLDILSAYNLSYKDALLWVSTYGTSEEFPNFNYDRECLQHYDEIISRCCDSKLLLHLLQLASDSARSWEVIKPILNRSFLYRPQIFDLGNYILDCRYSNDWVADITSSYNTYCSCSESSRNLLSVLTPNHKAGVFSAMCAAIARCNAEFMELDWCTDVNWVPDALYYTLLLEHDYPNIEWRKYISSTDCIKKVEELYKYTQKSEESLLRIVDSYSSITPKVELAVFTGVQFSHNSDAEYSCSVTEFKTTYDRLVKHYHLTGDAMAYEYLHECFGPSYSYPREVCERSDAWYTTHALPCDDPITWCINNCVAPNSDATYDEYWACWREKYFTALGLDVR